MSENHSLLDHILYGLEEGLLNRAWHKQHFCLKIIFYQFN